MKWVTLLKDFKNKVGITTQSPSSSALINGATSTSSAHEFSTSLSRDKQELELDFKRVWEDFRSSSSSSEEVLVYLF
ncbi:hypothetical protein C5167_017367 [Papaver somniferum]|uniref:Uncharacterized protein n=1 Tax=Papaver somniferum TaxID=3469 RepID=A0A4Y7IMJ9_PAPSO|nr:hypothetical protein C5167_017367 [Papaver somniferum]